MWRPCLRSFKEFAHHHYAGCDCAGADCLGDALARESRTIAWCKQWHTTREDAQRNTTEQNIAEAFFNNGHRGTILLRGALLMVTMPRNRFRRCECGRLLRDW